MKKILLVDDNDQLRTVFKIVLKGYNIIEAENGLEALTLCRKEKPDLILMDVFMPEMDGVVATRKILELNRGFKIIAMTAYTPSEKDLLDAGVLEVLKKPINKEELLTKINVYI